MESFLRSFRYLVVVFGPVVVFSTSEAQTQQTARLKYSLVQSGGEAGSSSAPKSGPSDASAKEDLGLIIAKQLNRDQRFGSFNASVSEAKAVEFISTGPLSKGVYSGVRYRAFPVDRKGDPLLMVMTGVAVLDGNGGVLALVQENDVRWLFGEPTKLRAPKEGELNR